VITTIEHNKTKMLLVCKLD